MASIVGGLINAVAGGGLQISIRWGTRGAGKIETYIRIREFNYV